MNKTYTFNGSQFTMLQNNLDLLNKANDMLVTYRKKSFEYTSDLDMSEVNTYRKQIADYKLSLQFIEQRMEEAKNANDEQKLKEEESEQIRVKSLLDELDNEFNNNAGLQNLIKLESDCQNSVLLAIMTDKDVMKKTLKAILKGDLAKLDFESPEIFRFIREVILDFFTFMGKNSLTSGS